MSVFLKKIYLSDEALFHLDIFANRHNCRIWGSENPQAILEKQMHHRIILIRTCSLIIATLFYANIARYGCAWHDDAICHTAREAIQLPHKSFVFVLVIKIDRLDYEI